MKSTFVFPVLLGFLFISTTIISAGPLPNDTLKVVTFNLYGAPNSDWAIRQKMILDELEQIQPDLIGFQEVVQTPAPGVGDDNRAKILADSLFYRTGYFYDFVFAYTHLSWNQFDEGIAILTRHQILDSEELALPPGLFHRKALWCRVLTPAGMINFFDTHLSFGNQEPVRIQQVQAIMAFVAAKNADSLAAANLLCGDFNAIPSSLPIHLLTTPDSAGGFYYDSWAVANPGQPGFTVPSNNPDARIDYIFLKDGEYGEVLGSQIVLNQPNANNIFPSDHFGVLSWFKTLNPKIDLDILSPLPGAVVSGQTTICWTFPTLPQLPTIHLYLSNDAGKTWWQEWSGQSATNSYLWNTQSVNDGTRYLLKVVAVGDSSFGFARSAGTFTVNNPGNAAPEIELRSPRGGEQINGVFPVRWHAADADGDTLFSSLDISTDNGATWEPLFVNAMNTELYYWNTAAAANSPNYRLRLRCSDGTVEVADTSGVFEVNNPHTVLPDSLVVHLAGHSAAVIHPVLVDSSQLTGHLYRITFDDTTFSYKIYDVLDVNTGNIVLDNATQFDGITEGPYFDGFRLLIQDFDPAVVNQDSTGWLIGSSTLEISVFLPALNIGGTIYHGIPFPYDYRITLYDHVVDTSSNAFGLPTSPMKFTVENLTENRRAEILYYDPDGNQTISRLDVVYILERDEQGQPQFSWAVGFSGSQNLTPPQPGDVFILKTKKPLTGQDIYEFNSTVYIGGNRPGTLPRQLTLYQNYPNPFNPTTTIRYYLPIQQKVSLTIYNILGQKIRTLENGKKAAGLHSVTWDGTSTSGHPVSSGIYFYRLKVGHTVMNRKMIYLR